MYCPQPNGPIDIKRCKQPCHGHFIHPIKMAPLARGTCISLVSNIYRLEEPIIEILYGAKDGVHAFGYKVAESEPIWMNSGAL